MPRTEDGASSPAGAASASLLIRLRGIKPSLSPAEDRVADIVLADARRAAGLTISELATAARTSETTVLRFCRRLGPARATRSCGSPSPRSRPSRAR